MTVERSSQREPSSAAYRTSTGTPPVLVERANDVAIVRLNRPERRNALDRPAVEALAAALADVAAGSSRVVVLAGAGPSFCAGLDLSTDFGGAGEKDIRAGHEFMRTAVQAVIALREMRQPVIAAVQGHAVGAGFSFAALADMRIVAPDARFNAGFVKLGMSAGDLGLSWVLPRQVGAGVAAQLFYSGGHWDAVDAVRVGFAPRIEDDALGAALELAHEIAALPAFAVQQTKELLNASLGVSGLREHLGLEMRTQVLCSVTDEHLAAVRRFRALRSGAAQESSAADRGPAPSVR